METQQELENTIGTKEPERETLQPKKVKIVNVEVIPIEKAKSKKVNCEVKHPDREETIRISSVAYLQDKAVITRGLWYNLDSEGKIQKGSPLAVFMSKLQAEKLSDLREKEVDTELDGNFLTFKAY